MVVEYGSPFLFSNASAAAARMKSFLRDEANDVSLLCVISAQHQLFFLAFHLEEIKYSCVLLSLQRVSICAF